MKKTILSLSVFLFGLGVASVNDPAAWSTVNDIAAKAGNSVAQADQVSAGTLIAQADQVSAGAAKMDNSKQTDIGVIETSAVDNPAAFGKAVSIASADNPAQVSIENPSSYSRVKVAAVDNPAAFDSIVGI